METTRETYSDGRLVPIADDAVYQTVAGAFGTGAVIHGVVFNTRGSLRVRITGCAALFGGTKIGRTLRLSHHWTVYGDPQIARWERERKDRERAECDAELDRKDTRRAQLEAMGTPLADWQNVKQGTVLSSIGYDGTRINATVCEIDPQCGPLVRHENHEQGRGPVTVGKPGNWVISA